MSRILQLRVTLIKVKPATWRVLLVPENMTFKELHEALLHAFEWSGYHHWQFHFRKRIIGPPDEDGLDVDLGLGDYTEADQITLADLKLKEKNTFKYLYHFDDDWQAKCQVEAIHEPEEGQVYPWCLEGEGNNPVEDYGGPEVYTEIVRILKNPRHAEYEDSVEILGADYDAKFFDKDSLNDYFAGKES